MPITLTCPSCQKVLKSNQPIPPGKSIKCPGCQNTFVPSANGTPAAPNREIAGEDDDRPRRKKKPRRDEVDEDDDDRPRRKKESRRDDGAHEVDEDGDRPNRKKKKSRRDDDEDQPDEDEDDRPRRKKKKKKKPAKSKTLLISLLAGGGLILMAGAIILFLMLPGRGSAHLANRKAVVALENELIGVMETVKDKGSAKAAVPRIDAILFRMETLDNQLHTMGALNEAETDDILKKVAAVSVPVRQKLLNTSKAAGLACEGEPAFVNALTRVGLICRIPIFIRGP